MANIQISGLSDAGAVLGTDQFAIDNSSNVTFKITGAELLTYINANAAIAESQVTGLTTDLAARATFSGTPSAGNVALWSTSSNIIPGVVSIDSSGNITAANNITASGALVMTGAITGAAGTFTNITDSAITSGKIVGTTSGGLFVSSGITFDGSVNLTGIHNITSSAGTFSAANLTATSLTTSQLLTNNTGEIVSSGIGVDHSQNLTLVNNITSSTGTFTALNMQVSSTTPTNILWTNGSGLVSNSGIITDGFGNLSAIVGIIASGNIKAGIYTSTNLTSGNMLFANSGQEIANSGIIVDNSQDLSAIGNLTMGGLLSTLNAHVSTLANNNLVTNSSGTLTSSGISAVSQSLTGVVNLTASGEVTAANFLATSSTPTQIFYANSSGQLVGTNALRYTGTSFITTVGGGNYLLGGGPMQFSAAGAVTLSPSTLNPVISGANLILNWQDSSGNAYTVTIPEQGPGPTPIVITGGTTLTAANMGQRVICRGSGTYTVTLPVVASTTPNQLIYFSFEQTTFNSFVTIACNGSDEIAGIGPTTLTFAAGESLYLATDGSKWYIDQMNLLPANITVGLASTQSIAINANTSILWDTLDSTQTLQNIDYNTGSGLFTPQLYGTYFITATVLTTTSGGEYSFQVKLTGTHSTCLGATEYTGLQNFQSTVASGYQFFNGQTDGLTAIYFATAGAVGATYGSGVTRTFINMWRQRNY